DHVFVYGNKTVIL
ncbi:formyltetrahydrofolate deformylase, partial [Vibrio harveyi]